MFALRKRDNNEPAIVAALTAIGCVVTKLNDFGVCDLLLGYRGRTILVEVKDPDAHQQTARSARTKRAKGNDGPPENAKGQLTPAQVKWWSEWTGGEAYVVETPEEAIRLVRGAELPAGVSVHVDGCHVMIDAEYGHDPQPLPLHPGQADALAGALHEQAGVARGQAAEAAR